MSTGIVEAPANSRTSSEDIEVALRLLATNSGMVRKTAKELGVHPATVTRWRQAHQERYDTIAAEIAPTIQSRIAEKCEAIASVYAVLEQKAASKLNAALEADDIPAR